MHWEEMAKWADTHRPRDTSTDMIVKLIEELGELASAHYRYENLYGKPESIEYYKEMQDAVGDIALTLMVYASRARINYDQAVEKAWNIVKERK